MFYRFISWNVNGIRACAKKGFKEIFNFDPHGLFIQEVKADRKTYPKDLINVDDYEFYLYPATRKGYAGVAAYVKKGLVLNYTEGLGVEEYDSEGRVQTFEFDKFFLLNVYFPNAQHGLPRLDFKLAFNARLLEYAEGLRKRKPVIIAGDFNVAHKEIDLANPKSNIFNPGFTKEEREWFDTLLSRGYVDTFRMFTKEGGHYTWWTYRFHARERNIGWRIDYFVVSEELKSNVKKSIILKEVMGSDHAPIMLEIEV